MNATLHQCRAAPREKTFCSLAHFEEFVIIFTKEIPGTQVRLHTSLEGRQRLLEQTVTRRKKEGLSMP